MSSSEAQHKSICEFLPANGRFPWAQNWEVRPLRMNDYFQPIYSAGTTGMVWNDQFQFDHVDDGAFRVKFHSDYDGMLIAIATGSVGGLASIDPFHIVIDKQPEGVSMIRHNNRVLTSVKGASFPRGTVAWLWVTYVSGLVTVGYGRNPGENAFMQAQADPQHLFGGGYNRFAIGRTGNTGAFECIDIQPLQRNKFANPNLRGTGFYE